VETTGELVELIKSAIPAAARREGGHPAKRVFQSLRIETNGELDALAECLDSVFERLNISGRFVIITFHSLEDRMVKQSFAGYCQGCTCPPQFPVCVCGRTPRARLVNKKPITASPVELEENNRSRSAKLRILERI
jgi:16S rRNA (cytosine1402-N4)-methyltransferase